MTSFAPIALFTYNRLEHTRRTVESVLANPEARFTDLIAFSDGARTDAARDEVAQVRAYLSSVTGFRSRTIVERQTNLGLAASIIVGVTDVLAKHETVVVMEDDLVVSPHFLRYLNDALAEYRDDERVVSAHAYVYPVDGPLPETFFLRGADCWGWATWRRGWTTFMADGAHLLAELTRQKLTEDFDLGGAFSNVAMLKGQVAGRNNSWAIRWHASAFLANKLTLYPGRSLVVNIGNDSSGTHCGTTDTYDVALSERPIRVGGVAVEETAAARDAFKQFGRANQLGPSLRQRIARALSSLFGVR